MGTRKRRFTPTVELPVAEEVVEEDDFKYGITKERDIPGGVIGACLKPLSYFNLKNPNHIGAFMFFFKNLLIQPPFRKYVVEMHHPDVFYRMVHLPTIREEGVPSNQEKLLHIENVIKRICKREVSSTASRKSRKTVKIKYASMKCSKNFIFDVAEQLHGGGHYTALAYINDKIEYMDPDPFFYGNITKGSLADFVSQFPNPSSMYIDDNIANTDLKRKRSIQNISYLDKFCQSWSLLFITLSGKEEFTGLNQSIAFQEDTFIPHITQEMLDDPSEESKAISSKALEDTLENFPKFIHNLNILFRFWIQLFSDNGINTVLSTTKFKNWTTRDIVDKLRELREIINSYDQNQYIDNIDKVTPERSGFFTNCQETRKSTRKSIS